MRNVRELFDSLLFPITELDLERRPRFSWFFVRHIDFRLNQLSHMLGRSAIESGVLENIKVDAFFVHFRFYLHELCASRNSTDFQLKSADTTLVSGDVT